MASGLLQDTSFAGLEEKATVAERVITIRFWGAAGSVWPQMTLRGRNVGAEGESEEREPEDRQRRDPQH